MLDECSVYSVGQLCCLCLSFSDGSAGKESACNVGDLGSIPVLGRSTGEGIGYPRHYSWASPVAQLVKNPPVNAGDIRNAGSIPRSGRLPGGGQGNPFQYSCLENPVDRGAWRAIVHRVTKSQTQLKQLSLQARMNLRRDFLRRMSGASRRGQVTRE